MQLYFTFYLKMVGRRKKRNKKPTILQFTYNYYGYRTKNLFYVVLFTAGQAVVQLVKALLYKREGRGFDS